MWKQLLLNLDVIVVVDLELFADAQHVAGLAKVNEHVLPVRGDGDVQKRDAFRRAIVRSRRGCPRESHIVFQRLEIALEKSVTIA